MKDIEIHNENGILGAVFDETGLTSLVFDGVEVLRGLSAPVRDPSWGTMKEDGIATSLVKAGGGWLYTRTARLADGQARQEMTIRLESEGNGFSITARFRLQAEHGFATNRAGFCLLHPLAGLRGAPLHLKHPDGRKTATRFPALIAPAQPARDIAAMEHRIGAIACSYRFFGEVFEMEDQRNWSDASYKTYCRPLSLPVPVRLEAGERIEQEVTIMLSRETTSAAARSASHTPLAVKLPELLLIAEPGMLAPPPVKPSGWLLREGPDNPFSDEDLSAFVKLAGDTPFDLEYVTGNDPQAELSAFAERLSRLGLPPRHVIALPGAYLKSYQPEGPWPGPPTPEDAVNAAATAFPQARIGAGMLTLFTELNRCPPPQGLGDYVTYGTSAIVHAADTESVFQTLEALPDIFASARALAGQRPQRLGLVAIPMRSNPYGAGLADNPDGDPKTMAGLDKRHFTGEGAAFAACAVLLAAAGGIEAMALAAPCGPLGLHDASGRPTPLADLFENLSRFAGAETELVRHDGGAMTLSGPVGSLYADPTARHVTFTEDN